MNPETYMKRLNKLEREILAAERLKDYASIINAEAQVEQIRIEVMAYRQKSMEKVQAADKVGREVNSLYARLDDVRQKDWNKNA